MFYYFKTIRAWALPGLCQKSWSCRHHACPWWVLETKLQSSVKAGWVHDGWTVSPTLEYFSLLFFPVNLKTKDVYEKKHPNLRISLVSMFFGRKEWAWLLVIWLVLYLFFTSPADKCGVPFLRWQKKGEWLTMYFSNLSKIYHISKQPLLWKGWELETNVFHKRRVLHIWKKSYMLVFLSSH